MEIGPGTVKRTEEKQKSNIDTPLLLLDGHTLGVSVLSDGGLEEVEGNRSRFKFLMHVSNGTMS
jgi:hypothetical protein